VPPCALIEQEDDFLKQINREHPELLRRYCRHVKSLELQEVEMIGADSDGFDVRADGRLTRLEFPVPVTDKEGARRALEIPESGG